MLPPPGRLSTITVPSVGCSFALNSRAWMSVPPPVANGSIMRIGRAGQVCASALVVDTTEQAPSAATKYRR